MGEADIARRNDAIAEAYRGGSTLRDIARHAGITMQRVHQILGKRPDVTLRPPFRGYSRSPLAALPTPVEREGA